jgi:hypothetical protein
VGPIIMCYIKYSLEAFFQDIEPFLISFTEIQELYLRVSLEIVQRYNKTF